MNSWIRTVTMAISSRPSRGHAVLEKDDRIAIRAMRATGASYAACAAAYGIGITTARNICFDVKISKESVE